MHLAYPLNAFAYRRKKEPRDLKGSQGCSKRQLCLLNLHFSALKNAAFSFVYLGPASILVFLAMYKKGKPVDKRSPNP